MRRRGHCDGSGQAVVEFALVLPVLVLVLLGLFDLGRGVLMFTELSNASRVGARVAIVNQSNSHDCLADEQTFKCAAAEITVAIGLDASAIRDLDIEGADCSIPSDCTAEVTVEHRFEPITPLIGDIVGNINLSASTTMPLERLYPSPAP